MSEAVEEAVAAWRRLNPELAEKVDRIAEIIEPGPFAEWTDSISGDPVDTARMKYKRARARRKAMDVLRYLGEAPETTDWGAIFSEMQSVEAESLDDVQISGNSDPDTPTDEAEA